MSLTGEYFWFALCPENDIQQLSAPYITLDDVNAMQQLSHKNVLQVTGIVSKPFFW